MEVIEMHEHHCICEIAQHSLKCDSKRETETGFCTLLFSNFTTELVNFHLDDSIKNYLNKQSIIF